jgi:CRP-like cAMP-binding protein
MLFVQVEEGECVVTRAGLKVDTLTKGQCFGEMALIEDEPRNATVSAKGACRCLALDRAAFLQQLELAAAAERQAAAAVAGWPADKSAAVGGALLGLFRVYDLDGSGGISHAEFAVCRIKTCTGIPTEFLSVLKHVKVLSG